MTDKPPRITLANYGR